MGSPPVIMNSTLAVMLLLGLLVVSWRFLKRPGRKDGTADRPRRGERRVEGFQVSTPLHVRMDRGCVFDHGMQFGPGFRRKEGPLLPHAPDCRCEMRPFAFSASEVFAGALRRVGEPLCLVPGFPVEAVAQTLAVLKRVEAERLSTADAFVAHAGLDTFPEPVRVAVAAFLRERYTFLVELDHPSTAPQQPPSHPLAEGRSAPGASPTPSNPDAAHRSDDAQLPAAPVSAKTP
jgi:hypothetical protein